MFIENSMLSYNQRLAALWILNRFSVQRKLNSFFYIFEYVNSISECQAEKKMIASLVNNDLAAVEDYSLTIPELIEDTDEALVEELNNIKAKQKGSNADEPEKDTKDDSINKETPFVAMNPSFKEEMNLKDIDFTEISNVIPDNKHANDPRNCYNKLVP